MFKTEELGEFLGEVSYLNESAKSLIEEIKEADKRSTNLKNTLDSLETVSKSLNYEIDNIISSNLDNHIKTAIDNNLRRFVDKSNYVKNISISIDQSIDILNKSLKKIERYRKYYILESLFYVVFLVVGAFLQENFKILNF